MHPRHVLIISAHAGADSLGACLAATYAESATQAGHQTKLLQLSLLAFDPVMHAGYKRHQELEPDLLQAQADIAWAHELVFVFPIWWGGMPALLKGFLDRVLLPGFAFRYEPEGKGLSSLLKGKTARLIITMDTPRWIDRWLYGSPVIRQLKYPILRFCGIKLREVLYFSPVIKSTATQRLGWIEQTKRLARRPATGSNRRREPSWRTS